MKSIIILLLTATVVSAQVAAPPDSISNWPTANTILTLTDPGANTVGGWDNIDHQWVHMTLGTGFTYTHSTHTWAASGSSVSVTGTGFWHNTSGTLDSAASLADETDISLSDLTTLDASTSRHGFLKKLSGTATQYMDGSGNWSTPAGSGGGAPTSATYITQTADGTLSAEQALSALATGILKNTTTTGVLSIATAKTDYWDTTDFTHSGTGHAHGLVPDPGATTGTTKFLREDATWQVPAGGGTGTVTNTGGNLTANAVVLGAGTVDTKVLVGFFTDGTSKLTLGGSTPSATGALAIRNSGNGDSVLTTAYAGGTALTINLPQASTTLVGTGTTDTLTNKSFDNTSVVDSSGLKFNSTGNAAITLKRGGSAGTTFTVTLPEATTTLVGTNSLPTGAVVGTTDTQTLTNKRITPRVDSSTSASATTWAPNSDTTDIFELAGALSVAVTTISNPSGTPTEGQTLMFRIKSDGSARALTWSGTQWRASTASGAAALPTTTTASKNMWLGFRWNSTDSKWDLLAAQDGF